MPATSQGLPGQLWREGAASVAAGAVAAATEACRVSQPSLLGPADVKVVGPLRISTADPLALPPTPSALDVLRAEILEAAVEALLRTHARLSIVIPKAVALVERTANGAYLAATKVGAALRRFVPAAAMANETVTAGAAAFATLTARRPVASWEWEGGGDGSSVRFFLAPVPVCVAPRGTVGLGDAISASGLAADALLYDAEALDGARK